MDDHGSSVNIKMIMLSRLTLCMLRNFFVLLLSSADFFFKIKLLKKFFQEHYQSVKPFGPRSGPTFCPS